jgi:transposase
MHVRRFAVVWRRDRAMARAYTAELRDRALRACAQAGLSRASVAVLFGVGRSTLYRWQEAWQRERRRQARPHAGGPAPRLDQAALDTLKDLVAERNDRTLAEYAQELDKRAGVKASLPTVCRGLKKLGLRRKKEPARTPAGPARPRPGTGRVAGRAGQGGSEAPHLSR